MSTSAIGAEGFTGRGRGVAVEVYVKKFTDPREAIREPKGGNMSEEKRYTVEEIADQKIRWENETNRTEGFIPWLRKREAEAKLHPLAVKVGPKLMERDGSGSVCEKVH